MEKEKINEIKNIIKSFRIKKKKLTEQIIASRNETESEIKKFAKSYLENTIFECKYTSAKTFYIRKIKEVTLTEYGWVEISFSGEAIYWYNGEPKSVYSTTIEYPFREDFKFDEVNKYFSNTSESINKFKEIKQKYLKKSEKQYDFYDVPITLYSPVICVDNPKRRGAVIKQDLETLKYTVKFFDSEETKEYDARELIMLETKQ
ncbi:MAG: hypothetical protein MJ237_06200 [bacterium]|nr:hypothetical protein [bacterium]